MNNDLNYFLFFSLIIFMVISLVYSNKKKKKTREFLKSLESDYSNRIKITGRVTFSKIRILIDVDLNIIYSENDLLIYGFDYYSDRKSYFIFHTNKYLNKRKQNHIQHYLITNIDIVKNEKIVITTEANYELILLFKSYGKEKKQLKEETFLQLIYKLDNEL